MVGNHNSHNLDQYTESLNGSYIGIEISTLGSDTAF